MSVSSRRRPRRQRRSGRGHSPPALPRGPGPGPAPARPLPQRAGPGSGRGAAARLFVRRAEERRDAGQAASRSPPLSSGPEAEEGPRGCVGAPLSTASRAGSILCGEPAEGRETRRGPWPRSPGRGAGPRGRPPPARGAVVGPGALSPRTSRGPRGGREAGVGRGGRGGRASQGMRSGGGLPALAGLTGRPDRAVRLGPPRHLRGEEGMALASPQSGLRVKNAAIWRLAVPGLAPKVEITKIRHLFRQVFFSTTDNTVLTVFHDNGW